MEKPTPEQEIMVLKHRLKMAEASLYQSRKEAFELLECLAKATGVPVRIVSIPHRAQVHLNDDDARKISE